MKYLFTILIISLMHVSFTQPYMIQAINDAPSIYFNPALYQESYAGEISEMQNNWTYFSAGDSTYGAEVWKTNGDTCTLVKDVYLDAINGQNGNVIHKGIAPFGFTAFNNEMYLIGLDTNSGVNGAKNRVWQSNGLDIWAAPGLDSVIVYSNLITYNNVLVFLGYDETESLYKIFTLNSNNGILIYTVPTVFNPIGSFGSLSFTYLIEFQNKIYFIGHHNSDYQYLYEFDGTQVSFLLNANVSQLNFFNNINFDLSIELFMEYNNALYFTGYDTINGYELRKFDGNSVSLVADLNPGIENGCGTTFKLYNGMLYFEGNDGVNGWEMWTYDGVNVQMVHDLSQGVCGSNGQVSCAYIYMEVFNNKLYFTQDTAGVTGQLWMHDGTNSTIVKYMYPNHDDFYGVRDLKASGPYLYFRASDSLNGEQLWRFEACEIQNTQTVNSTCVPRLDDVGNVIVGSTVFKDTLLNSCGGDSVLTTNYTYYPINTSVSQNQNELDAIGIGYYYQWIDCNTGQAIVGETNQNFTASDNGQFAVVLTAPESGCSDTSACYTVVGLGIGVFDNEIFGIYPNPSKGSIAINVAAVEDVQQIKVFNVLGEAVSFVRSNSENNIQLEILGASKGVYVLKIQTATQQKSIKLLVE
ncbi:T9SS type A sorting domain-containing protein [Putridiphycobacter roseus]|nr:T9SS type A sorting domain-containing protein [Putridiphycobacter roseus]